MSDARESGADKHKLVHFDEVRAAEIKTGCAGEGQALGLAFSGGGIRSATFNLGVTQALAEKGLLKRFHYLSTISGGGYIGGWLSLFIKRFCAGDVAVAEVEINRRDERNLEHPAVRFLRSYSNYLTPRIGLSKDTLVAVATYLRNLLLNLCILIALMAALLILPRIAALVAKSLVAWDGFAGRYDLIMIFVLILPTFAIALGLFYRQADEEFRKPWFMRRLALIALVDAPVVIAAFLAACFHVQSATRDAIEGKAWSWSVLVVYVVLWVVGVILAKLYSPETRKSLARIEVSREKAKWQTAFLAFAVLAGAVGGGLLLGIAKTIAALPDAHRFWAAVTFGPPAIILVFLIMVTAHVGLMGRKFAESDRELWSVYGARLLAVAIVWVIFFAIALYGAATLKWANHWIVGMGGVAWVASTLFGIFAGKSEATGGTASKPWIELLTRLAPYVFVLGLLLVLSWGLHRALIRADGDRSGTPHDDRPSASAGGGVPGIYLHADPTPGKVVVTVRGIDTPKLWDEFLAIAGEEYAAIERWFSPPWALPAMAALAFIATLLLSWRVNINLFSLHHFYRNRLTRCYLGATNPRRRPNPLTGFDPADDVAMSELGNQRPFHIIGTAINLNRGRQLAWQNRRAASFAFTPLHAGYEPASRYVSGGFRAVAEYGKDAEKVPIQLGTTVAISGAAASPNQGFHTSPAVAFLMTVFNVRLGHWCGDPAHRTAWQYRDPLLSLRYWLAELTGTADLDYPFVSLSDGGHFENLAIYELVRRRCAVILASDASADPKYAFDDLAEAMRKCYTDFGVKFEFKTKVDEIRPTGDDKLPAEDKVSLRHYAVAEIKYPGETQTGTLIYWKSSLTKDLPPDIMHYRRTHKDFPHETTADQFFDESQFESYRHLGYEVAMRSLNVMRDNNELPPTLR